MANALYYGNNLGVLRHDIASDSVYLVYLDPPFNSQANYNVLRAQRELNRRLALSRQRVSGVVLPLRAGRG